MSNHTLAEDYEHFLAYTNNVSTEERLRLAYEHGAARGEPAHAVRSCSDERMCINCFANQGECLGPYKDQWQPIETAPKDGTHFLAYHPTFVHSIWVTFWRDSAPSGFTHWMPLPAAPTGRSKS